MFKTIHTSYGLAAITQAETTGTPIDLTDMAVGDDNGNAVAPDPNHTRLVRAPRLSWYFPHAVAWPDPPEIYGVS
jgi:phage-related tail fiber protein